MASINASTSGGGGIITTADATGNLNIQSGGSTVVAVTSAGATVTGTLAATGAVTLTGSLNTPNTFGFKNRIINGGMVVNQRGSTSNTVSAGAYGVDRFLAYENTSATSVTASQSTTSPTGFINSYLYTVTTGGTATAAQQAFIRTKIEGLNIADFAWGTASAATITVSFWVRSSLTGTYCVYFRNDSQNRCYVSTYTILAANTWEQKIITVAGDTSGTWLTDNNIGVELGFDLGSGSNNNTAPNAWTVGGFINTSAQANLIGTSGATFYITGVQLEKGSTATSFDFRAYSTELAMCQRYYYRTSSTASQDVFGTGFNNSSTRGDPFVAFPVTMRTQPTALEQSGTAANYGLYHAATSTVCSSVPAYSAASMQGARVNFTVTSGLTTGQACMGYVAATGGYLGFSAEL